MRDIVPDEQRGDGPKIDPPLRGRFGKPAGRRPDASTGNQPAVRAAPRQQASQSDQRLFQSKKQGRTLVNVESVIAKLALVGAGPVGAGLECCDGEFGQG